MPFTVRSRVNGLSIIHLFGFALLSLCEVGSPSCLSYVKWAVNCAAGVRGEENSSPARSR